MASESFNGGDPAAQPSRNGAGPDDDADTGTAFERFERLTRKLVAVPKAEVDKRLAQAKRPKRSAPTR